MSTLLDIWEEPETSGVFTVLNNYDVPWKSENVYESLNLAYFYNHSGQKSISPLVSGVLGSNATLTDDNKAKLGRLLYNICNKNWTFEYNALFSDYNPIENYNADETETINQTGSKTGSGNTTNTGTDTTQHTGTDTLTRSGTDTHAESGTDSTIDGGTDQFQDSGTDTNTNTGTDDFKNTGDDITKNTGTTTDTNTNENGTSVVANEIYGYNSSDAADDSKSTTTVNQTIVDKREDDLTTTLTHGLDTLETKNLVDTTNYGKTTTETKNLSSDTTYGHTDKETIDISEGTNYNSVNERTLDLKSTSSETENTTGDTTRTLKRHGNIGVTTSQQMIESELELRKKFFFEIVFSDIDKYLTLAVY